MNISSATALITGGASGLGLSIAKDILSSGGVAIVIDRNASALEAMGEHSHLIKYHVNLLDTIALFELLELIFSEYKVNVLINNAGILHNQPLVSFGNEGLKKLEISEWDMVMDINLKIPFILSREMVEHCIKKRIKGVIVNITSISAQGNIGQTAYAASKAGLEAFTKVVSKEVGPIGIRIAAVAPGFMNTESTHQIMNPSYLDNLKKQIPLRKLGTDSEIAKAVRFIIENDYFTGKVLPVDGGLIL
jgi:3-oxoacyl-[acyl-carrier protein] reductase